MERDLLRATIQGLLQESDAQSGSDSQGKTPKKLTGTIAYYKIKDPVGKFALVMPGITHPSYSPDMPKTVMELCEDYLWDFSYAVPNGPAYSVAAALEAIKKDKKVDINAATELTLIGHSAGGANVLSYITSTGAAMFNRIYLLDPTPIVTSIPASAGSKSLLIHNAMNWSDTAGRRKNFLLLGKSITDAGGHSEESVQNRKDPKFLTHMGILDIGLRQAALGKITV